MAKKEAANSLDAELAAINQAFGSGTVIRMDDPTQYDYEVVTTGILPLDVALGCGGYPRGRVIEIFGGESSGKTTVALTAVAQFQQAGMKVLYIDVEHSLDTNYARALGVDVTALYLSQPDTAEQVLEIALRLVRTGELGLVVVDSVAMMTPRAVLEGEVGDAHIASLARIMSTNMPKLNSVLDNTGTTSIWINQQREKPGVVYGSPVYEPGGRALKFAASVRMEIYRGKKELTAGENTHNRSRIKIVKNKCGPPFREVECDLVYGAGIPRPNCVFDMAVDAGFIKKAGAWYNYTGEQLGQGRANALAHLSENPQTLEEIEERVRDAYQRNA